MQIDELLSKATQGFETVKVGDSYKQQALKFLRQWLTEAQFSAYVPQIVHMIETGSWDALLDAFYQVIPFGTGGRRGEVGIGPNRINPWTIQSSAQGHSQFLLRQYGEAAKTRGVVIAYDVRQFTTAPFYNDALPNPVKNLNGKQLSEAAAQVYAANGIKTYLFDGFRSTPELSFAVRHLHAVSGDVISASHNPPSHNGKKVYDEFGGQLIPPDDEALVEEVTQRVSEIKTMPFDQALSQGLVEMIGQAVDDVYVQTVAALSLSQERNINIVFTPLHACGTTSVLKVLQYLQFPVYSDPETSNPSGAFEHVTFNIPNPEVIQSFDTTLKYAKQMNADIILNSDPDADRIGIMVNHHGEWKFINGNEIAGILTEYVISKRGASLQAAGKQGVIIKTDVTTNLMTRICEAHQVRCIGDLLVGFKYVGAVMNELEKNGEIDSLLMGCEESHGYIAGNYVRDKDAAIAGLWLAELAAELKREGKTLLDYLYAIYAKYGYFRNYLTEIRMPGAEGMSQIQSILNGLRSTPPTIIGRFELDHVEDWLNRTPIMSETDRASKNAIVLHLKPVEGTTSMRITVRPSGTEPKVKMYIEIGSQPFAVEQIETVKAGIESTLQELEKAFMKSCYKIIGVDFPDRGFLLFWQLPLKDKMHYFEIEEELAALRDVVDATTKKQKFDSLMAFLGSDPIQKVDAAFQEKYNMPLAQYIGL